MILIDSLYVNESGGETLLKYLIKTILHLDISNKFFFLFDDRFSLEETKILNHKFIHASEINRKAFYKKNKHEFSRIFCFANVPPPINFNIETFIYFQNDLLIDTRNTNFTITQKTVFLIKRFYIKLKDRKNYNWIVQTELIKEKLGNKLLVNKSRIKVIPFYHDNFNELKIDKIPNSFLYVSGYLPHKNHYRLIKAFVIAAEKLKEDIHLNLTLKSNDFSNLMMSFSKLPSNLIIENLGVLSFEDINLAYENNESLIFPSLKESFGLPLIEATLKQLYVICSNLEYTHYVIEPSLSFNPLEIEDISNSIYKTLTLNKLNKPKLITKNKINQIINMLTSV